MSVPDERAHWWKVTDVAAYLHVQVATISKYRSRGLPEPEVTVGRTRLWRPATIINWQASRPRGWRRCG